MIWMLNDREPRARDLLGLIPSFLREADPRPAREQIDTAYAHGGGWRPFRGFTVLNGSGVIQYPGDSALEWIAAAFLRDEVIRVYPHAWVSITQPDGSTEIARMD